MNARLITCSISSKNLDNSRQFYSRLIGQELGRSLSATWQSYYGWASSGVKLTVNESRWEGDGVMLHFAVDDLDEAVNLIESEGGHALGERFELQVADEVFDQFRENYGRLLHGQPEGVQPSMGTGAVVADPDGNRISLIQLNAYAKAFFEGGEVSRHEMLTHQEGMKLGAQLR